MWARKRRTAQWRKRTITQNLGEDIVTYDGPVEFEATLNRLGNSEYESLPENLKNKTIYRLLYRKPLDIKYGDRITLGAEKYATTGDEEVFVTHCELLLAHEN